MSTKSVLLAGTDGARIKLGTCTQGKCSDVGYSRVEQSRSATPRTSTSQHCGVLVLPEQRGAAAWRWNRGAGTAMMVAMRPKTMTAVLILAVVGLVLKVDLSELMWIVD